MKFTPLTVSTTVVAYFATNVNKAFGLNKETLAPPGQIVIPFGNEDDNGNGRKRKKERELETSGSAHDHDNAATTRFLSDVVIDYGPGGFCELCGGGLNYQCSSNAFGSWDDMTEREIFSTP